MGVYMCDLRYLHANGETRFARRRSGVRPGRKVRRARRAAGRGETGGKGGTQTTGQKGPHEGGGGVAHQSTACIPTGDRGKERKHG